MLRRFILAAALGVTLVVALVGPATAGDQRPFRASFTGTGIAVPQRCPNALTLGFAITGVATHLGHLSGSGTNCTEFTLATEAVAIWDGIVTLEAADGSTLTMSSEGSQGAPVNGVAAVTQTLSVVSGTGRFDDAAGDWALSARIDFSVLSVSGAVTGWLSY
jgi:hypothetical protein